MNNCLGSYINIGFVNSAEDRRSFVNSTKALLGHFQNKIQNCIFNYPIDENYNEWKKDILNNFDDDKLYNNLCEKKMSQLSFSFFSQGEVFDDVLIGIDTYKNDSIGLVISIRQECICKNRTLDNAEQMITSFMHSGLNFGFAYAYCDTEAYIEANIADILNAEKNIYSVLIIRGNPNIELYSNWKIDGLTQRNVI